MTMQLIQTVTVGSGGASSVTFSSIPQDGTDLVLLVSARSLATNFDDLYLTINGSISISNRFLQGNGSAASSNSASIFVYADKALPGSSQTSNTFGSASITIPNYAGSTLKPISVDAVSENNGATAYQTILASLWDSTSAVTSLTIQAGASNLAQYTTASLYKITKGSDGIVTTS